MRGALRRTLGRLKGDTSGNTLMIVGLSMIPLLGAVGLGLDITQWVVWKRQLHSAADLAAVAGARALADKQPVDVAVKRSLGHNDLRVFNIDAIENAPASGTFAGDKDAVLVSLSTQQALPFSGFFLRTPPKISVSAVAQNAKTVPNCVISLDTASTGITVSGSSRVNMNCGMASNSNFDATTSDYLNAGAASAVGVVNAAGGVSADTTVNNGIDPVPDPYAGKLPLPDTSSGCFPGTWPLIKSDAYVSAGCYAGLQIQGGITTLAPGTYYIGEKGISIAAGATLRGYGVTLIFTSTANPFNSKKVGNLSVSGSATLDLTAQTTGTYAGVLMYQDPRTPDTTQNELHVTGNSLSRLQGAIYAPSVGVTFTGNSGMTTDCLQIVALYASFEGNTDVTNNCPAGSGSSAYGGSGTVRLVG